MAQNSYDGAGTLRTSLPREGVDIGPQPDFWGDMGKIVRTLRPIASPQAQVSALRAPQQQAQAPQPRYGSYDRDSAQAQAPPPRYEGPDYSNYTGRSFGHPSMSPQGVIGNYVNPLDVPLSLHGQVPTGFFTDDSHSNYTYSPTVNPARYATSPTQREQARG